MASYLLVIGDREALGWILTEQRMAFSSMSRPHVRDLAPGDTLLLYTTRGCFKNPTRDRGRIVGHAMVEEPVRVLDQPVTFGDRTFPVGCSVAVERLVPLGRGIELVPLLDKLTGIRSSAKGWTYQLRQPLVPLTEPDRALVAEKLSEMDPTSPSESGYLLWWGGTLAKG
jgi:hypothetical protein